jgi:HSP20 family protein
MERNTEMNAQGEETKSQLRAVAPAVDIFENEDELLLIADLPGVEKDKLSVKLERGELALEGEAAPFLYRRAFTLPHTIDGDRVDASLDRGVLRVTLPKAAAMKTRQVPIKLAH